MTEQISNKNSLDEMKKDIKSLLGIKRNKEPTAVDEKNRSTELKKEKFLKEDDISKKSETDKFMTPSIPNKKDYYIDLTLDENNQANSNHSQEKSLNINLKKQVINIKDENINEIEKEDQFESKESNGDKIQDQLKIPAEITLAKTPSEIIINPELELQKEVFLKPLNRADLKTEENLELNNKNEAIINSVNINEITSIQDDKIDANSNKDSGFKEANVSLKDESAVIEQQKEIPIPAGEVAQKENIKPEIQAKPVEFNVFSLKNLARSQEELIDFFKAPTKNIFENINKQSINFIGNKKQSDREENKETPEEKKAAISINNNEYQIKENEVQIESHKEKFVTENKKEIPQVDAKLIINEASKAQNTMFSIEMVPGLENQKDQIIKMFSKPTETKNPFEYGIENTRNNLFFNNNSHNITNKNVIETDQKSSINNTELNLDKTKHVDTFGFAESPYKRTEQIFSKMDLDKNGLF